MLAQVVVGPKDISIATAITICKSILDVEALLGSDMFFTVSQSMGSAIFIPVAQSVFQNSLLKALKHFLPQVNPTEVMAAGANSAAVHSLAKPIIPSVLQSYVSALRFTFAIGIPLAGISLLVSLFMPWFKYGNPHQNMPTESKEIGMVTDPTEASTVEIDVEIDTEKMADFVFGPNENAEGLPKDTFK